MVVNETKTEFCIFHRTKRITKSIEINNVQITSKNTMKALGITLDTNLNWETHVNQIARTCDCSNMGFRILKRYFNREELLKLATSLYYSKMYYAAEVWLLPSLNIKLQKTLLTCSSKILKTITGIRCDENDKISYLELHKQTNRATPSMMTSYIQATCLHRIMSTHTPEVVYLDLLANHIETRRHYKPGFAKTNWHRVGENILHNRVQKMTDKITLGMTLLSYDQLKMHAKREFLSF